MYLHNNNNMQPLRSLSTWYCYGYKPTRNKFRVGVDFAKEYCLSNKKRESEKKERVEDEDEEEKQEESG